MEVTHSQLVNDELEQLRAELAKLREENESLRARVSKRSGLAISKKRALSVFGINSVPVTLYANQWQKLADMIPQILKFIEENKENLSMERPADYKTIGQEAKERGEKHLAGVMYNRTVDSAATLKNLIDQRAAELAKKGKVEDKAQQALPGLAATPVVQKQK